MIFENVFDIGQLSQHLKNSPTTVIDVIMQNLYALTDRVFQLNESSGLRACIFVTDGVYDDSIIKKGSVVLLNHNDPIPPNTIILYEALLLPQIYLKIELRLKYREKIRELIEPVKKLPQWKQCFPRKMCLDIVGKGSYGNVFIQKNCLRPYAVKLSKIKKEFTLKPYNKNLSSWHEVFILKNIIEPIIRSKKCPNLPLIYDTLTCSSCTLFLDGKKQKTPCIATVIEYANGTMKQYLSEKRSINELYSALFQVMAGIYAIQLFGQIMNFDVKKENILMYDVEPGGYWHYIIMGNDFYVPNYGKMFVLNDYGISRSMSPNFVMYKSKSDKTFRLGSRYGIIYNGKIVPLEAKNQPDQDGKMSKPTKVKWISTSSSSHGAEFRISRKTGKIIPVNVEISNKLRTFLNRSKTGSKPSLSKFFLHPDLIPPFEFYNDTQDGIRLFVGGKRTTQKGNHRRYPTIPDSFVKVLKPYIGPSESAKNAKFSTDPAQLCAGYFIVDFFTRFRNLKKGGKILDTFKMS